ncbi:MAG: glycerophosphodiester phosphodiesterase [Alphaproteobacteria bacterium]|nr:glycerophosphodiester phosphodiesterase [Alphaproteobacteria bacterium]
MKSSKPPDLDWLRRQPIAHRGLHGLGVPENSRAAFVAAIAAGFAIELDVQFSADGAVMVFHDESLRRMTGIDARTLQHSAATLGRLALLGTAETIPTLAEVLALVAGRVPVLVEIKYYALDPTALARATWEVLRHYHGPVAVQSFDPRVVGWFDVHAGAIARGQLLVDLIRSGFNWRRRFMFSRLLRGGLGRPHFLGWDVRAYNRRRARDAAHRGLPVAVWTVKTPRHLAKARRLGANVIFEDVRP